MGWRPPVSGALDARTLRSMRTTTKKRRMKARRLVLSLAAILGLLLPVALVPRASAAVGFGDIDYGAGPVTPYGCTPRTTVDGVTSLSGTDDCLPTPEQCATGSYNGVYPTQPSMVAGDATTVASGGPLPRRIASCLGGGGHVVHYVGGDLDALCGDIVEADNGLSWEDPNFCPTQAEHGKRGHGRRYEAPVTGSGVVVSESQVASKVGAKVLRDGGNAVDAAVATVFAAGVGRPGNGGIGGNGHLIYRSAAGEVAALDFEAKFPAAATPEMFAPEAMGPLGGPGNMPGYTGHRIVAIPGVVAGMYDVEARYGAAGWVKALQYPIDLLDSGGAVMTPGATSDYANYPFVANQTEDTPAGPFTVNEDVVPLAPLAPRRNQLRMAMFPHAAALYTKDGRPYNPGEKLDPPEMKDDLRALQKCGKEIFYDVTSTCDQHNIGRLLIADMDQSRLHPVDRGDEGLMTADDLKGYTADWRTPASTTYHGLEVFGPPAPDYGAAQVLESLNILEPYNLGAMGFDTADHRHLLAETQKLARADAVQWIGDPKFSRDVTSTLTSKDYATKRRALIDMKTAATDVTAGDAAALPKREVPAPQVHNTDSVSVIDKWGNAIVVTFSLNQLFGSAVVAPGTGFLLNSNIDPAPVDSTQAVHGGHRAMSPISPIIVTKAGRTVLALGGVGGDVIPQNVLEVITDMVDFGQDVATAVDAPRSHEFTCCDLYYEDWRTPDSVINGADGLVARGHTIKTQGEYMTQWGNVEAAASPSPGVATASGDRRTELFGAAAAR